MMEAWWYCSVEGVQKGVNGHVASGYVDVIEWELSCM